MDSVTPHRALARNKQVSWLVVAYVGVVLARVALTGPRLTCRTEIIPQPAGGMNV